MPICESLRVRRCIALLVLLALLPMSAFGADAPYEVAVEIDVMAPMRDGVRLATDIYRPAKDGAAG